LRLPLEALMKPRLFAQRKMFRQQCRRRGGWICFQLEGPFACSETGVLASFIAPLAERYVPIFAVSTYDTDYLLVQQEFAATALGALTEAGHALLKP
jgi:hypothetical protein